MKQNENEQNYKKIVHAGRGRETKWEIPKTMIAGELGNSPVHRPVAFLQKALGWEIPDLLPQARSPKNVC
jgi:hypothetical protein